MSNDTYRIVLADDHAIFRLGLRAVIENDPSYKVVGEAANGVELLDLLNRTECDLVILDLSMPGRDGFSILDEMSEKFPAIKRVVLSMHVDKTSIKRALAKRIDGFVNKEDITGSIISAVASIRQDKKYFSRDIQDLILSNYDDLLSIQESIDVLTKREKEVAGLIASGQTNKEVASLLFISIHTVQFHRSNIMSKLNLKNTADLVKFVMDHNL